MSVPGQSSEIKEWLLINATTDITAVLAAAKAAKSASTHQHRVSAETQAMFTAVETLASETSKFTELAQEEEERYRSLQSAISCHAQTADMVRLVSWVKSMSKVIRNNILRAEERAQACEDAFARN